MTFGRSIWRPRNEASQEAPLCCRSLDLRHDKILQSVIKCACHVQASTPAWSPVITASRPRARDRASAVLSPTGEMWVFAGFAISPELSLAC